MNTITSVVVWYITVQLLGLAVWPLTQRIFPRFPDRGWGLSKALGLIMVSYLVWLGGSLKLVPFIRSVVIVTVVVLGLLLWLWWFYFGRRDSDGCSAETRRWYYLVIVEELLFAAAFAVWVWVRAHYPAIHGLEKFMDYGFVLSILRGKFFPPLDHFLAGFTINYYYFGHLMAGVLIRLSGVLPEVGYNLQIASIFALTVLESFSLGAALYALARKETSFLGGETVAREEHGRRSESVSFGWMTMSGVLASLFVAVIGNLHLVVEYLAGRLEEYWYASASRLVPFTINEFPVYSFVVADLHGHVSDLPVVLLFLATVVTLVVRFLEWEEGEVTLPEKALTGWRSLFHRFVLNLKIPATVYVLPGLFLAFLLGVMYATNSWDFAIYGGLIGLVFFYLYFRVHRRFFLALGEAIIPAVVVAICSAIFFLPYWLTVNFSSQGLGLVYSHTSWKHLLILWGFYFFLGIVYLTWLFGKGFRQVVTAEGLVSGIAGLVGVDIEIKGRGSTVNRSKRVAVTDVAAVLFIVWALILLVLPEAVYLKDIYAQEYYRANTMFKLYYQAWVLFAVSLAFGVTRMAAAVFRAGRDWERLLFLVVLLPLFTGVMAYPVVAVKTNFTLPGDYVGLDGNRYLERRSPADAEAIDWLKGNITGQPFIVEAVGESYTDYARICSNTGLPAVLGWPVHEWLWRGSWDIPQGRQQDVEAIYETPDATEARQLLSKYDVDYVYIGEKERTRYSGLIEDKFAQIGEAVFRNSQVIIYKVP